MSEFKAFEKRRTLPPPSRARRLEAFIPTEEIYDLSAFAQFEKIMETEFPPENPVCSCDSPDDLKARYRQLRSMSDDPNLTGEQKRAISQEATEVLDQIMRGSQYYRAFQKARSDAAKPYTPPVTEEKFTFKEGMPESESRKYRRF